MKKVNLLIIVIASSLILVSCDNKVSSDADKEMLMQTQKFMQDANKQI